DGDRPGVQLVQAGQGARDHEVVDVDLVVAEDAEAGVEVGGQRAGGGLERAADDGQLGGVGVAVGEVGRRSPLLQLLHRHVDDRVPDRRVPGGVSHVEGEALQVGGPVSPEV